MISRHDSLYLGPQRTNHGEQSSPISIQFETKGGLLSGSNRQFNLKAAFMSVRISTSLVGIDSLNVTAVIESEPEYIVGLNNPGEITESSIVMHGNWIIICVAPWSPHDLRTLDIAVKCVKRFKGKYKLGIIPFNDIVELRPFAGRFIGTTQLTGYSQIESNLTINALQSNLRIESKGFTPYWVFLRSGVVNLVHQGPLTDDELNLVLNRFLPLGNE